MKQKEALDILKLGYNVFLTGAPGSGKTHVLRAYISYLKEKGIEVGITAPTGIAANHLGGITLHSWSGIGIHEDLSESMLARLQKRAYLVRRIRRTKVLIIDEVSMVSSTMLDSVDTICRTIHNNNKPFGGIQVVISGDFFQLPPVTNDGARKELVFQTKIWRELDLKVCYLSTQYRQVDETFLTILNEIRNNSISSDSIKKLSSRLYSPLEEYPVLPRLYTHNDNVDTINDHELSQLPGPTYQYVMTSTGSDRLIDALKKSALASEIIRLKIGAMVMFVKNNKKRGYVNGSLGWVVGFGKKNYPMVRLYSGKVITALPETWTIEEEGRVRARLKQVPLKLSWAMTIHKSQGMNLDAAEIDLGRPFAAGMGYVALSRVRNLDGVRLLGLNRKALEVPHSILKLDARLKQKSLETSQYLKNLDWLPKQSQQMVFSRRLRTKKRVGSLARTQLALPMFEDYQ